jgi:hypothetical protein
MRRVQGKGAHTFVTRVAFIQPATLSRASSSGSEGRKTRAGKCLAKWTMCSPEPACHFTPTPILSDGEVGAVLHLLALFQSYDAATSLIEDRDLTEAAHEADHRASTWMKHWSRSRCVGNRAAALSSVEAMAS